jgi:UDP-N-acetylmuramoyl-L-alanyl-D-glutamate--2,6-diaminopimelate ligase
MIAERSGLVSLERPVPAFAPFAEDAFTVGVTGTNGKTSTTLMIFSMLRAAGHGVALETTLGVGTDIEALTSRGRYGFLQCMQKARAEGIRHFAVEVTSEALARGWAKKWRFDLGVFTNLSRDHLDAHGTFEHYLASKAQLFVHLGPGRTAVLNAADPACEMLDRVIPEDVLRSWYAVDTRGPALLPPTLAASTVGVSPEGTTLSLVPSDTAARFGGTLRTALVGAVFAENTLAAALAGLAAGLEPEAVHAGLSALRRVPGRFEIVARTPLVAVDYAHTPDALARTCDTARELARGTGDGRVIVVFGAGGNRDTVKRRPMGEAVGRRADFAIVTNDNPRGEDPRTIARTVESGCRRGGRAHVQVELDRKTAIQRAIELATARDVVLICGKGHETGQTIGSVTLPFDDANVVREWLATREGP